MDSTVLGFVGGLLGTIVGGFVSIKTSNNNSRTTAKLQNERNLEDRTERKRAVQRDVLHNIQDLVGEIVRDCARIYRFDLAAYNSGKPWGENRLDDEFDEACRLRNRQLSTLTERVLDDELRSAIRAYHKAILTIYYCKSSEQACESHLLAVLGFDDFMIKVGTVLRQNY